MVPTDVEKSTQHAIIPTHNDNWLPGNVGRDELAWPFDQVRPSDHQPALTEDGLGFQFRDARVNIPRRGNSGSFRQRCPLVVTRENLLQRLWHDQTLIGQSKTGQSNIPKDGADFMWRLSETACKKGSAGSRPRAIRGRGKFLLSNRSGPARAYPNLVEEPDPCQSKSSRLAERQNYR